MEETRQSDRSRRALFAIAGVKGMTACQTEGRHAHTVLQNEGMKE